MSYRLPTDYDWDSLIPESEISDFANRTAITVENGTITRIGIPCCYGGPFSRIGKMVYDYVGWPSPGNPDRSDYQKLVTPINLEDEGYTSVEVVLGSNVTGLTITGRIDFDVVELTIDAQCTNARTQDYDVDFAVYVTGTNTNHPEDDYDDLRDVILKGTLHILAGLV